MSSAQALVAGTSGCAGGSQIEIFRSTGLSWAIAGSAAKPRRQNRGQNELLHGVFSRLFVTPTISTHDRSANRVYSAAPWMHPDAFLSPPGAPRSTLLGACLDRGQPLDDALGSHQGFAALDPRDRAFVRLLLATTLRRLGEIDEVLGNLIERPLDDANAAGLQVLRLGAAQLLFLGTPPHAAVDTSVRLVEQANLPYLKGLTNAVLRRISREGRGPAGRPRPGALNTPAVAVGVVDGELRRGRRRAPSLPPISSRRRSTSRRARTPSLLGGPARGRGPADRHACAAPAAATSPSWPGFAEGAWWVQDAAATMPARLMGDLSGKRVADLCAAPGGKTMQLCAAGAAVTAVDISARRMIRLGENLARSGLSAETGHVRCRQVEDRRRSSTPSCSMRPAPAPAPCDAIPTSPG